jgi:DNA-binding phage protein
VCQECQRDKRSKTSDSSVQHASLKHIISCNPEGSTYWHQGRTEIAKEAGVSRSNLYKALSPDGNPEFATVAGVLKALGLRLSVAA